MTSLVKTLVRSAVALSVLCSVAFAQQQSPSSSRPKAAVYIMGNPDGRDALASAVNTFLIQSGKYQMIAVDAIDVVAQEQNRQMSGSVSDGDIATLGRDAGAQYVCVVQRSELDGVSYVATRMVSVQSKVAELASMTELPRGGKIIEMIQWQIGSMLGMPVGPKPTAQGSGSGYAGSAYVSATPPAQPAVSDDKAAPPIQGTVVQGGNLAQKLAWLQKGADSHTTYIIEVSADEKIAPYTFDFSGGINITVVLRGVGGNRTIRLSSNGTMFTVMKGVTFVLDRDITLMGHNGNTGSRAGRGMSGNGLVSVNGGTFNMNTGATITGNGSGGVYVRDGIFEMNGGTISGNTASVGGGVCVGDTFIMNGGTISGNTASKGGGVAPSYNMATITIRGGTITGNTARECGGGVYVLYDWVKFTKTGGTITGYKSDPTNGNAVKDEDGTVLSRKGHAVYLNDNNRKETTAGPNDKFSSAKDGAWDQ